MATVNNWLPEPIDLHDLVVEKFDTVTVEEILTTGYYGHIWSADIHVSGPTEPKPIPKKKLSILFPPKRGINWHSGFLD